MKMRAARMYGLNEPLRLEEVDVPDPGPGDVLVKVGATGMCRSDVQLIEGYFTGGVALAEPIIPGHEVAGWIAGVGPGVPATSGLSDGDLVVVNPNWGDGTCRQCREGNEQICANGKMAGFGPPGGFAEYMPVPYRHVIKVPAGIDPKPETLAPLTDAGLTPYRGMKKLVQAGKTGAGRTIVVNGIGGLGSYGVQYARLLSGGATVVAFARSDEKLTLAIANGAHHGVNTRGKSAALVQDELEELTGRRDVDGWLDCIAAEESLALGATILAKEGVMSSVGLMGNQIVLPLLSFTNGEKTFHGSFWGNYDDLAEVLDLATQGFIKHTVTTVALDDVNDMLEALGRGDIVGRAVITFP
ncbi:NAD(P)-dependent alcohol dehydrogenase [Mycobacterium sp. C31M]